MNNADVSAVTANGGLDALLQRSTAYDLIASAVGIVDAAGTVRYANAAFQRINGALRDSVDAFSTCPSLLHGPVLQDALTEIYAGGGGRLLQRRYHYSPNQPVTLGVLLRPIVDAASGATIGALLTIAEESVEFDRHHLARAQNSVEKLSERILKLSQDKAGNERLVRMLMNESPFAMVLMNPDRQVIQINRAGEKLFGLAARDLIGSRCDTLVDCHVRCGGCPVQQRGSIDADEIDAISTGTRSVPLLRSAVALSDQGGELILEAFVDLSERRRAEQEYRDLSDYNRLLLEATGDGIFGVGPDLRCTFANRAAAGMLGYAPEQLVGMDIGRIVAGHEHVIEGAPERHGLIAAAMRLNASQIDEDAVFVGRDGKLIPVQYLCNPISQNGRITGAVVVYRNVAEARAMARKMDYLATHDSLTGLINRRVFEGRLEHAIEVARQDRATHVLAYIDLDQFKIVNDTCGHAAGDELLRQLAGYLQVHVRKTDVLARLGGDEFGLLLAQCSLDKAVELIGIFQSAVAEFRFGWDRKTFVIGASIGVVVLDEHTANAGHALSAADSACYMAKEHGRDRVHVYRSNDQEITQRRGEMERVAHIRESLAENRLSLSFQPIVQVQNPKAQDRAMEILVRMHGKDGQPVHPGAFIPAAERYQLMSRIDRWVVERTLNWLNDHCAQQPRLDLCTINLSGQSIGDERFLDFLLAQLRGLAVPRNIVCFEITETAAVSNLGRAASFIESVKNQGCRFALDDFGSGMSSFAYLKNLPVDFLKIDGNFVKDMATDTVDYAMVEAIHRVGSVMGIQTIAEFVENEAILACLAQIGVDLAQGYGICRPQPLSTRPDVLARAASVGAATPDLGRQQGR